MAYDPMCDDDLDPHYDDLCGDVVAEKGRIRRGAWLRKSAAAAIIAAPTNAALWTAAIVAGNCIVLPELTGTFDGGTPKYGDGYGDADQKYLGVDCTANIKDPVYKQNYPHYRSLVGKTSWLFVYLTETQLHITDVGVTVAPKNPITNSVQDDVVWEAEIKWFQYFTPQPFTAPDVFGSATPTLTFDTNITFGSAVTGTAQGITGTVTATDADLKLEFNKITTRTGTPASMNVNVGGVLKIVVDFTTDYLGMAFRFTDASGVTHVGVFTSGTVSLT